VQKLIEDDNLTGHAVHRLSRIHVHMIGSESEMLALGTSSKYNIDADFLSYLKAVGRDCADRWLTANWDAIGKTSSIDLKRLLQGD
jgi:NTE family protein